MFNEFAECIINLICTKMYASALIFLTVTFTWTRYMIKFCVNFIQSMAATRCIVVRSNNYHDKRLVISVVAS